MSLVVQIPCVLFHNFPETVENLKRLCNAIQLPFSIPENQTCCGLPYFGKGEQKAAKTISEYNLTIFGNHEILSPSLKCENTYTISYPKILNNTVSHVQCMKMASATKGLDFLFSKIKLSKADFDKKHYFFIADCADQGFLQKEWLKPFGRAQFSFPKLENTCCGAGFCLPSLNHEEAGKMTNNLIQQAIESGADTILASNEICLQQIRNNLPNSITLNAMHLIDLYANAL
ncbi:MAG: (Fe-S)-binding protein [bacterium]|nr:(Fe-S)-binding protein [bacterium]